MNKWQYLPRDRWFLTWKALGVSSPLADFGRLRTSSEDFGRLRKTSDFFGNLRKWSCRLQKSQHSQDKNLTLISQKKLAGIQYIKFIFTFKFIYLTEFSRSFCLKHSRHRESVFPLNSKNDTLIVFHPYANWSRWRDRCKTCCGVGKWWSENHTYLFRALDSIKNIVYRNI